LVGWNQTELAEAAGVGVATLRRLEAADELRGSVQVILKIQTALEKAGIEFIPADEMRGHGVRLRLASKHKPKRGKRGFAA
jgi:transcriptional regulator with XRE-family HTH domain